MIHFKNIQQFKKSVSSKIEPTEKISESTLQEQIVNYLLSNNIFCFSVPNGFYGGRDRQASIKHVAKLKKQGLRVGVADLIVLLPKGKAIFLELKVGYNKQELSQKQFQKDVETLGFEYYLVKSLDEAKKIIIIHNEANLHLQYS